MQNMSRGLQKIKNIFYACLGNGKEIIGRDLRMHIK